MIKLSALILTRNEQEMIEGCLSQLDFVDEIIILDQNSQDQTLKIAEKFTDKIYKATSENFDENRNSLLSLSKGEWVLYVDADERFSQEAISEIKRSTVQNKYNAFYFPRKNYILGRWLRHGGWWPDYVPRFFKREKLQKWEGEVHESPKISGEFGYLNTPIEHLSGRTLSIMLAKTIKWAQIEAKLFEKASNPKVTIFKVIKASGAEFVRRYFLKRGFLDGTVGLIESLFQAIHQAIIFTYLWEIQNKTREKFDRYKSNK